MAIFLLLVGASGWARNPLLAVNFESGSLENLPRQVIPVFPTSSASDAIEITDRVSRSGKYSTQVTVRNSPIYVDPGGKTRAEYTTLGAPGVSFNEGDRRLYKFSLMLSPEWAYDSRESPDIVWQFKRTGGKPDMFAAVKGSDLVLRIGPKSQITVVSSIRSGVWVDIVLDVIFSSSAQGRVAASYRYQGESDFSQVPEFQGPTLGTRPGQTYLKWGIYKPDDYRNSIATGPHIIFVDDISVFAN